MKLTNKQKEFIREANHRFNIKQGATRSGKTYLDILYTIPSRLRDRHGKEGLNVILGVSKSTIQRNIIEPLAELYGNDLIKPINSNNMANLFGEDVYCLGAEKVNQVSKIRGASIKYCYCDELAEYNEEVFELLKSRLDKEYSVLDATLNPESPTHWLKQFIDRQDIDIYNQTYTIFDNEFLPKAFVDNLCKEYEGTVYYNRYILGQWCNAEGLIYRRFADNPDKYSFKYESVQNDNGLWEDNLPDGETIVGIDYGGTKSGQAFVCTRISRDYSKVIVMASQRIVGELDAKDLENAQIEFMRYCRNKYHCEIDYAYPDNEETVHIRSLRNRCEDLGWSTIVRGCNKEAINDRIKCQLAMLSYDVFRYVAGECDTLVKAMESALWDDTKAEDTRLDNFTTDIDSLDAYEYSFERYIRKILDRIEF
jgi:PBSX family phage terminase large subunit